MTLASELAEAVASWDRRGWPRPKVAVVAGSGLSVALGDVLQGPFDLAELLPFEARAIKGHPLAYELVGDRPAAILYYRGRLHAYQGFSPAEVVFAVRLAGLLGAHTLIISNAAGGIYRGAQPGDLGLISDHINLTGLSALCGDLPSEWGPQFPDMVDAYDPALRRLAQATGERLGLELGTGVYVGVLGPSYETPAEIEAFRRMGADLVGMSTVLEVTAARQLGMRCLGISLVTNPAAGTHDEPTLDHEDVLEVGRDAARGVEELLRELLSSPEVMEV